MRLVLATFLSPSLEPLYRATADVIARTLHCEVDFAVGTSYEQFARREVDLGFICSRPYVELADSRSPVHPIVAPVVAGPRYENRPIYFSDVVVRRDRAVRSFEDLRGARWCFNSTDSHSGYGIVLHHLAALGRTPAFFGSFEASGFHTESLRLVAAGEYDSSAVDSHLLDVLRRTAPQAVADLRVIDVLGPSTIQPLVAAGHVNQNLREEIRAVLTSGHPDESFARSMGDALVQRFVAVGDESYDDIRSMMSRLNEIAGQS